MIKYNIAYAEVATHSKYFDDVAEVSKDVAITELDIVLKNGDIVEAKNWKWTTQKIKDAKPALEAQLKKFNQYNPNVNKIFVFKEGANGTLPLEIKTYLESLGAIVEVLT